MKVILPTTLPGSFAKALEALGFDILLTSEPDLVELFYLSGKEGRILFTQAEFLSQHTNHKNAHGIIALGAPAQTTAGFKKHVLPHLRAASQEAQFEAHVTFFNGRGGVEIGHLLDENQKVRERVSIPRGTNEQFLHFAKNGLRELRSKGILIGGFTRTRKDYQVERHPTLFHFLGVIIQGQLEFSSGRSDFKPLNEKCTFIIPSGTHCTYRATRPTEFLWLHIHTSAFGQGLGDEFKHSELLYPTDLIDYCQHFRSETRNADASGGALLAQLANVIKIVVHRNVAALGMPVRMDESRERLKEALRNLEGNLANNISVSDLARSAGTSVPRLYRTTRRYFNKPPGTLIEEIKIRHASELLLHTDYKLEKVAEMTGYSDAFSFSRAFKRITGDPPSVFRKRGENASNRV